MHFITRAMPIDDIDGKSHKTELKSDRLFNQSYKVKITPLVIYGLGDVHTHTHKNIHARMHVCILMVILITIRMHTKPCIVSLAVIVLLNNSAAKESIYYLEHNDTTPLTRRVCFEGYIFTNCSTSFLV